MIKIDFDVERLATTPSGKMLIRRYTRVDEVDECEGDGAYLVACSACDMLEAIVKSFEDDTEGANEFLRIVQAHVKGAIL